MLVQVDNLLRPGGTAKDLILHIIGAIGTAGATGHVIEYAGAGVTALEMAERMTLCNMSIEAGARAGMIAPDEKTFRWLADTPMGPKGDELAAARAYWSTLHSDEGAIYDKAIRFDEIGRAAWRERVCHDVWISGVAYT